MSAKRFNPYNVSGPSTDGHVVRLNPGQELHLQLDDPIVYKKYESDAVWEIVINSQYVSLLGSGEKSGRKLFRFGQTMDMKRWSEISTTFLGNIMIYAKDSKAMTQHASLCLFLGSNNPEKANHIVAVNPIDDHCVKLEPHQLLEVVFPDSKDSSIQWRFYQHPIASDQPKIELELLRSEVLPKDQPNNRREVSEAFYAEHRESTSPRQHQRHYWFGFGTSAKELAASSTISETRPATRLFFFGKDPCGRLAFEYSLQVNLLTKNEKRVSKSLLSLPDEHYCNPTKRLICNPHQTEHIVFNDNDSDWIIEIQNPFPDAEGAGWEASVTEVALPHCQVKVCRLEAMPLLATSVSGMQFQRFEIHPVNTSLNVEDNTFLGVVSLKFKGGKSPLPIERTIFCFFRSKGMNGSIESDHTVTKGLTPPYSSRKSSSSAPYKEPVRSAYDQSWHRHQPIYSPAKQTITYSSSVPCYSEVEIVDHQITDSIAFGERTFEFGPLMPASNLKKNGRKSHESSSGFKRQQPVGLLPGPNPKRNGAEEKKSVIAPKPAKSEKVLFDPPSLSQIHLLDNRTHIIRLPINDLCIWAADFGNASDNFIVNPENEIFQSGSQYYQSFAIKHLVSNCREVGVLMLTRKHGASIQERRTIIITANEKPEELPLGYVAPKDPIEAARNHVLTHQAEQFHGLPAVVEHRNMRSNRVTLLDPLGTNPKQVEIDPGEELEIVLHEPYKTHAHKGFRIETMMYSGMVNVPDNSLWPLWNNQRVQRVLLKFGGAENISGRVFVMSGSTRAGQVEIRPRRASSCPINRQDLGFVQWGGLAPDGGYRVALFQWEDGQALRVRSTSHASISLERPSEILAPGMNDGVWSIETVQNMLMPEISSLVPGIDRYHPWMTEEGFLTPGPSPWNSSLYAMKPLSDQQPAFELLIQAMQKVMGNIEAFPIGEVIFKYTIPKKFTIQKRLKIELVNNSYYNRLVEEKIALDDLTVTKRFFTVGEHNFTAVIDPKDSSSVVLDRPGDCLLVKLPAHRLIEDGSQQTCFWNLFELPAWLTFIGEEDDGNGHQLFFFHFDHGAPKRNLSGRIVFMLGSGFMTKRIWVRGCF